MKAKTTAKEEEKGRKVNKEREVGEVKKKKRKVE